MKNVISVLSGLLLVCSLMLMLSSCKYMKMNPPPDADKPDPDALDNSCYLATASNMLAGAGYGTGSTVQERTDEIYAEMIAHFGIVSGGWTDAALSWWLGSTHNTWAGTNPYTIVTVYGNKIPKYPWANANGAQFIGNELRDCQMLGLSISWPTAGSSIGDGGHAITAWGDEMGKGTITTNPTTVRVTDSDTDSGGDVQVYNYDDYTNPNPGGANEGNGWYLDYEDSPYIKHIITLCPVDDPTDDELTQKVVGSYRIHQSVEDVEAEDLHYRARTDVNILSYRTTIDWTDQVTPTITEANPRRSITVDWDLTEHPIEYCTWVTITTEFVLPRYNAIFYDNVYFTYPEVYDPSIHELHKKPDLYWWLETPILYEADKIPNVTGGYVIADFKVVNPALSGSKRLLGEYRLVHQYSYDQDPEDHEFLLAGSEGYMIENLRFGHSYGYPSVKELWDFENWMTVVNDSSYTLGEEPFSLKIDWEGKLPYPEGEVIPPRVLKQLREKD